VISLRDLADQKKDYHLGHMLEKLMTVQVLTTKKLGDYITQCKQVGPGQGEWEFDKVLARCYDRVDLGRKMLELALLRRTVGPDTPEELADKLGDLKVDYNKRDRR
jgi:hypothetical protein